MAGTVPRDARLIDRHTNFLDSIERVQQVLRIEFSFLSIDRIEGQLLDFKQGREFIFELEKQFFEVLRSVYPIDNGSRLTFRGVPFWRTSGCCPHLKGYLFSHYCLPLTESNTVIPTPCKRSESL